MQDSCFIDCVRELVLSVGEEWRDVFLDCVGVVADAVEEVVVGD